MPSKQYVIKARDVKGIVFDGDDLVDWVSGGIRYGMNGSISDSSVLYGYKFDSAMTTPSGSHIALYERLGTKGLLLDRSGKIIREINRSFYHAEVYEYPVCIWDAPDGRPLIAHCPDSYDRIEIEDIVTSERLTQSKNRSPCDFFHSRLQINNNRTMLLTAGWVWHPWDAVGWFDLNAAFQDATHLDKPNGAENTLHVGLAEESSACWQTNNTILIGSSDEPEDPEEVEELGDADRLQPGGAIVYDIPQKKIMISVSLSHPPGVMMPVGTDRMVTFYTHPRLYSISDGRLLEEWPDLPTGTQTSSIQHHIRVPPPIARDSERRRFAVALGDSITVVEID